MFVKINILVKKLNVLYYVFFFFAMKYSVYVLSEFENVWRIPHWIYSSEFIIFCFHEIDFPSTSAYYRHVTFVAKSIDTSFNILSSLFDILRNCKPNDLYCTYFSASKSFDKFTFKIKLKLILVYYRRVPVPWDDVGLQIYTNNLNLLKGAFKIFKALFSRS